MVSSLRTVVFSCAVLSRMDLGVCTVQVVRNGTSLYVVAETAHIWYDGQAMKAPHVLRVAAIRVLLRWITGCSADLVSRCVHACVSVWYDRYTRMFGNVWRVALPAQF